MDLNTVSDVVAAHDVDDARRLQAGWRDGDAWLAGGTLLFSEPHTELTRLLDVTSLGWPALTLSDAGLEIGATCTIAEVSKAGVQMPDDWLARPLFHECCTAFLASFKVWNLATVGGNICTSYPAGPMISLTAALDGVCEIWTPDGGVRREPVASFVTGAESNTLAAGELLRAVRLPVGALRARTAFRKIALSPLGRSGVVIIGRLDGDTVQVTVTAATERPVVVPIPVGAASRRVAQLIDRRIPLELYASDAHGASDWRRQVTHVLADEIVAELSVPEEGYPEGPESHHSQDAAHRSPDGAPHRSSGGPPDGLESGGDAA
jgi:CO/xanthine dehydrogenase FAD-binding subunit